VHGILLFGARFCHCVLRYSGQQFMGACLAQVGLRRGKVVAARSPRPAQPAAGHGFVPRLRAHNSLFLQCHGPAGIGLLMLEVCLRLRQRSLRGLYLRLSADRRAGSFTAVCSSVSTVPLSSTSHSQPLPEPL